MTLHGVDYPYTVEDVAQVVSVLHLLQTFIRNDAYYGLIKRNAKWRRDNPFTGTVRSSFDGENIRSIPFFQQHPDALLFSIYIDACTYGDSVGPMSRAIEHGYMRLEPLSLLLP